MFHVLNVTRRRKRQLTGVVRKVGATMQKACKCRRIMYCRFRINLHLVVVQATPGEVFARRWRSGGIPPRPITSALPAVHIQLF
jgi:hypothetical protein